MTLYIIQGRLFQPVMPFKLKSTKQFETLIIPLTRQWPKTNCRYIFQTWLMTSQGTVTQLHILYSLSGNWTWCRCCMLEHKSRHALARDLFEVNQQNDAINVRTLLDFRHVYAANFNVELRSYICSCGRTFIKTITHIHVMIGHCSKQAHAGGCCIRHAKFNLWWPEECN